jgi:hypothetical protein
VGLTSRSVGQIETATAKQSQATRDVADLIRQLAGDAPPPPSRPAASASAPTAAENAVLMRAASEVLFD